MSKVMRSVKNVTKGYSHAQVKVRDATSNDPWGPTGTQMSEIAQMTFNTSTEFYDIMDMLDKRLNDKGKNWRHVLKALKVLDYCLHEGSELVVTWARQSIYIIKTLREFQYIDEEGRDVGQNVRVAAKELTSLILNDERLRAERSDRKSWKSRVMGLEEFQTQQSQQQQQQHIAEPSQRRQRERRSAPNDEDDTEYRLAIEASKYQEEEDKRKRAGRSHENDDDLAKALQLSREEEERRRRQLEEGNASSLFDDDPQQLAQPQHTGFNQGYQQGNPVDFFANPIQTEITIQPTGFLTTAYTGYQQPQQTGWQQPNMSTGFGMDSFSTMQNGQQQFGQQSFQHPVQSEPSLLPGSNNPWATNNHQQQSLQPTPTGSNNPFAQINRPQSARPATSHLGALPEQKVLSNFTQTSSFNNSSFSQTGFNQSQRQQLQQQQQQLQQQQQQQQQTAFGAPKRELSEHEAKLNALLMSGDGLDTYGNTGELRIPAQHTAPGTFVNSAGSGVARVNAEMTGNNPFLRQQTTGLPSLAYSNQASSFGGQGSNNPFGGQQRPQQQNQANDLIQF